MSNPVKIFVYGTLKPGEVNYPVYCEGKVIEAIRTFTWGQLFHLPSRGYPAMIPGDQRVEGFLLTFVDETVLEHLDQLEDYHPLRSPQDNEYERQRTLIYTLAGKPLEEAWTYWMTWEKVQQLQGIFLPSGWWEKNRDYQPLEYL